LTAAADGILVRSGACPRHYFYTTEVLMSAIFKMGHNQAQEGRAGCQARKIFTRLLKEIAVAAKGGGNPDTNARAAHRGSGG